jgi:NDP-sugar pyrophosphorylase family protein
VKKKQVMNYFQDGARLGVQIQYSESKEAQGTAGEIARARDLELISGTFLLYYGDTLTGISLKAMTAVHRHYNALITTPTIRGIPLETSLIETDFDGRITRFSEKPLLMEKANIPVFVVDKSVLRHANIAKGKDFSSDVVSQLVALGRVFEYDEERHYPFVDYSRAKLAANGNYHYDVGTLKRYEDICRAFEKGYAGAVRVIK